MNSDNGVDHSSLLDFDAHPKPQIPSNVTRICRAIEAETADGIPQVIYYQAGVGSSGGVRDRIVGGSTGLGLSEHIREAYDFISNNYHLGDEIILLGFSRGAYTARSISGLIGTLGVLTKAGMDDFYAIFMDYENAMNPDYRDNFPDVPFPDKPNARDPEYRLELRRRGLTTLDVNIKAVGVWDTVGALGIPRLGWLDKLDKVGLEMPDNKFCFDDTIVGEHVENAFQALALDEQRAPFSPAVWLKKRGTQMVRPLPTVSGWSDLAVPQAGLVPRRAQQHRRRLRRCRAGQHHPRVDDVAAGAAPDLHTIVLFASGPPQPGVLRRDGPGRAAVVIRWGTPCVPPRLCDLPLTAQARFTTL